MEKQSMREILEMINAKIEHIEDITADNRAVIIKLVKQSNQVVQFLKNLEIQMDEEYTIEDKQFDNIMNILMIFAFYY